MPEVENLLDTLAELRASSAESDLLSVASPPRKLPGPLPRSIISKIVTDYQAGSSTRQLATKYDRSKGTILRVLKHEGVTMRPSGRH